MIDLSGVARTLRLGVDQLRVAADLLEQGYQPGFIQRYRADETGNLPRSTLWLLKLEIDRQKRLQMAREKASGQLPKDAELDGEAKKFLDRATTEVEIEAALRTFRSRRLLSQNQEADAVASSLLEKLIEYEGRPAEDMQALACELLGCDATAADAALQQASRLVAMLMNSDTGLNETLRRSIQKRSFIQVQLLDPNIDHGDSEVDPDEVSMNSDDEISATEAGSEPTAEQVDGKEQSAGDGTDGAAESAQSSDTPADELTPETHSSSAHTPDADAVVEPLPTAEETITQPESSTPIDISPLQTVESTLTADETVSGEIAGAVENESSDQVVAAGDATENSDTSADASTQTDAVVASDAGASGDAAEVDTAATGETDGHEPGSEVALGEGNLQTKIDAIPISFKDGTSSTKKGIRGKSKPEAKPSKKSVAKMTPRQRRRRWLIAMLQPMKSLKRPLTKLTAYQQLMLGRGRRSQLVKTELEYDKAALVAMARDTFVSDKHPLAKWFSSAAEQALESSLRAKLELEAVTDLEEIAAERLLETAVDQLRQSLMQRPVRGHCILVIDAVGPKAAAVAIISPSGKVLAVDEIPCSASPTVVNQNVVRLGELVHQYKVTLVALTNGPARRFLVLSLRELVKQSESSGLRWTMADRGGADAYAVGRAALRELSIYNRRHRAAIWVGRSLQDPLSELLKVDINRLRLGSFQRELPQEPLKKLVRETISDCVCYFGIDTLHATVDQLQSVCGVGSPHAQQIATLAGQGKVVSRKQLLSDVSDWPETESRQAIGLLRIYGSEQPLDATIIHPDDYRLAERLAENTELALPPAAPEKWQPPQLVSLATAGQSPVVPSGPESAETVSTEAGAAETEQTNAGPTGAESAGAESTQSEATATDASAAVVSEDAQTDLAGQATDETAAVAEAEGAENAPQDDPNLSAEVSSSSDGEAAAGNEQTPASKSGVVVEVPNPEYPEDVIANPQTGPQVDVEKLARGWQVGREKLRWVAECLHDPFGDRRLSRPPVPLLKEMPTLSNLQPEQCLWAVVIGVADFGAFVELAPDCSGLIHISRLSPNYIEDPHQCVQVGDLVMAWVVSVDEKKNRVALTALSPAERAAAEAVAAERRAEQQADFQRRDRGPARQQQSGGGNRGESRGGGERPNTAGASTGGGQNRSRGGSGGGGDGRRDGGARSRGGQQQGGNRGRGNRPPQSKTVVVTSKKPKANITEAMKEGEEPLRSFSDLLQFYEAKRTEDTPPPAPPSTPSASAEEPATEDQAREENSQT